MGVVDNDIVLKGACYGLLPDVCGEGSEVPAEDLGVLSSCRFVVADRIRRHGSLRDTDRALQALAPFLEATTILDPTEDEQRLAADIEFGAQGLGLPLDAGESQLCAVLVERSIPLMLTGDKRAIVAMEQLLEAYDWLSDACGKVRCLEQLILVLIDRIEPDIVRACICGEPHVDTALGICFSCHEDATTEASIVECLESYINHLRSQAPHILAR
jgi:hypothetical protein